MVAAACSTSSSDNSLFTATRMLHNPQLPIPYLLLVERERQTWVEAARPLGAPGVGSG